MGHLRCDTIREMKFCIGLLLLAAASLAAQTREVEITAEPAHRQVLQNAYVRVFKVEAPPHAATRLHRHRHDYVFVTLGASEVVNEVAGKPPVTLKLGDGETRFVPGGFAHVARNLANTPFRNVTIELLQDAKARKSASPKWDEERGMSILHGGTQDILFVEDGVRVSEVILQPGGMIPEHGHIGPHLVVAVSNLELRSDVRGKLPSMKRLPAGDVAWVPGHLVHTITNVGTQPAKFITLEFQ